jgi:hypothetical protein
MDLDEAKWKLERDGVPGSVIDELVNEGVLHIEEHRGVDKIHAKLRLRFQSSNAAEVRASVCLCGLLLTATWTYSRHLGQVPIHATGDSGLS